MNRILIALLIGSTLGLMQMWVRVDASTAQDVRKRAENYKEISQKLQILLKPEKDLIRRYLKENLEIWFQKWEIAIHRSAVYPGYLGCNPDKVMDAISLIRSKLEKDALKCMENNLAEFEDLSNRSVEVAVAAEEIAKLSEEQTDLKKEHFDALLECMPEPKIDIDQEILAYAPSHFRQIVNAGPVIISNWKTFQSNFNESRRACFNFYALEFHGTTADIVYLFEECVRGDITDWVHAETHSSEMEIQALFKILLRHAYTRPANLLRSLTAYFDTEAQVSVTSVRKSYCAYAAGLIGQYEKEKPTILSSECSRLLPQLKSTYADLITQAYNCLHGTYSNFLASEKMMELDAVDMSLLMTNSNHLMNFRYNMSVDDLTRQIKNKVLPIYDRAREKDDEMLLQFDNDVENIQKHMEQAHRCFRTARQELQSTSLELANDYVACMDKDLQQKIFIANLKSDHIFHVLQQISREYDKALLETLRAFKDWEKHLDEHLTVSPRTTPVCQTVCMFKAYPEIVKLKIACWEQSFRHLKKVRLKMTEHFQRSLHLRRFIRNGGKNKGLRTIKMFVDNAILLSNPTAEKFQIDGKNCVESFANLHYDQSEHILREFQRCFKSECKSWRWVHAVRSWGVKFT